MTLYSKILKS